MCVCVSECVRVCVCVYVHDKQIEFQSRLELFYNFDIITSFK